MFANQITAALKLDKLTRKSFVGVFSCDKLDHVELINNEEACIVVNTAPSNHSGLHWILLYKLESGENLVFFDSLAKLPQDYGSCLENIVKHVSCFTKRPNNYTCLNKVLQSGESAICGVYCIYAAHQLCRGKSISMIQNKFSDNKNSNDKLICDWHRKNYHSKITRICGGQQSICSKLWKK
jgi:hypothetical protein